MKAVILGSRGGWHTVALQQALATRGVDVAVAPVTALRACVAGGEALRAGEERLDDCELVLVRAIPGGSLEQIIFRMDALYQLERRGVRVVNSARVIERTVDKYYTSALLEAAGLPTPRTLVAERFEDALAAYHDLGGDVVVKPIFGSEGRGMARVSDPDTAYRVLRALELGRYVFYLQEYVPHHNQDYRLFVINRRVVAAMRRRAQHWKTNVAQGAQVEPLEHDNELWQLALRASAALGATYAGVDILPRESGGYVVVEVNGIPGWRGLQEATGYDAAAGLVDALLHGEVA